MNKLLFYPRLAIINLKKNKTFYFPYLLVCTLSSVLLYSLLSLYSNPGLSTLNGAASVSIIFLLGIVILSLFSIILFFYTNSFLMKRRQKEFALYSILGMGKKHICRVLFFENLITGAASIISGILLGILISRLVFLIFLKMVHFSIPLDFYISIDAILITTAIFVGIFLLLLLRNIFRIYLSSPVSLLQGSQSGEKEPKASWILTVLGILSLGAGYYIAIVTENPLNAIGKFFIAVLFVIIGTYFLFISGSIAALKFMKKRKAFFYKPRNFIAVSGMLYRMKQNAAGLASICILCTMVLVTLSTTVSLYLSADKIAKEQCPNDISIRYAPEQKDDIEAYITASDSKDISIINYNTYRFSTLLLAKTDNQFFSDEENEGGLSFADFNKQAFLTILPLEDYNQLEGQNIALEESEILFFSQNDDTFHYASLFINNEEYAIKEHLSSMFSSTGDNTVIFYKSYLLVVRDMEVLTALITDKDGSKNASYERISSFDIVAENDEIKTLYAQNLHDDITQNVHRVFVFTSYHLLKEAFFELCGGFLFLGVFLGIAFLAAAALIIYYKQLSEGYQDYERFSIMKKVGLSEKEIKKTVNKQILLVFFLPLTAAILHIGFSLKFFGRLLLLFGLTDFQFIVLCAAGTVLIFSILYMLIYKLTSNSYMKLIK